MGEAHGHDPSNLPILSDSDVGFLNLLEPLVRTFTLCILQITPDFMPHHDQSKPVFPGLSGHCQVLTLRVAVNGFLPEAALSQKTLCNLAWFHGTNH